MYGNAQKQPKLVQDFDEWIETASLEELRETLRWQRASAALMQTRMVRTLDGFRELRTMLRLVIEHAHAKGHPLQGEALATLQNTSVLMQHGDARAVPKDQDQAVGA